MCIDAYAYVNTRSRKKGTRKNQMRPRFCRDWCVITSANLTFPERYVCPELGTSRQFLQRSLRLRKERFALLSRVSHVKDASSDQIRCKRRFKACILYFQAFRHTRVATNATINNRFGWYSKVEFFLFLFFLIVWHLYRCKSSRLVMLTTAKYQCPCPMSRLESCRIKNTQSQSV